MSIVKETEGVLAGYSVMPFDTGKALDIIHAMQHADFAYGLGSKAVSLSQPAPPLCRDYLGRYGGGNVHRIDCSGFTRYAAFHAAGVTIPDGSVNQLDFMEAKGFKVNKTAQANDPAYVTGMNPKCVYMCFCRQGSRGEAIGHVWFAAFLNGHWWSMESHASIGPDSRRADSAILARICTHYVPICVVD